MYQRLIISIYSINQHLKSIADLHLTVSTKQKCVNKVQCSIKDNEAFCVPVIYVPPATAAV